MANRDCFLVVYWWLVTVFWSYTGGERLFYGHILVANDCFMVIYRWLVTVFWSHTGGERLMLRWLEASDVLYGQIVGVARFEVFVEYSEDLVVQNLELTDTVNHPLQGLKHINGGSY